MSPLMLLSLVNQFQGSWFAEQGYAAAEVLPLLRFPLLAAAPEEDFSPGLFLGLMVFLALFLTVLLVGLVLATLVLLLAAAALGLGILSTSMLVGLHQRSVSSGLKTFVLLTCGGGGMVAGVLLLFFINAVAHWGLPTGLVLALGLGSGLGAGGAVGAFAYAALQAALRFGLRRLQRS